MRPPTTPKPGRRSALLTLAELFVTVPAALCFGASSSAIAAPGLGGSRIGGSALAMSSGAASSEAGGIAVVGCGVLGTSLCRQLLANPKMASRSITGITKTTSKHEQIKSAVSDGDADASRFHVSTADDLPESKFRDVVFCAPPSGFDDYPGAVADALQRYWDKDLGGCFVFTSSGGIYGQDADGETVTETSPTADPESSPRAAKLVAAESACTMGGGCVLRLAGLYTLERGAHNYWLENDKDVQGRPDGIINLLHYDDAAGACMAAIEAGSDVVSGKTFLISDSHPTTRLGICQSAIKAARYADKTIPNIIGGEDAPKGKIYDGSWSDATLNWEPQYESFDRFMSSQ